MFARVIGSFVNLNCPEGIISILPGWSSIFLSKKVKSGVNLFFNLSRLISTSCGIPKLSKRFYANPISDISFAIGLAKTSSTESFLQLKKTNKFSFFYCVFISTWSVSIYLAVKSLM